jgi:CubicO group peptidase (beta-lactamase class C family)
LNRRQHSQYRNGTRYGFLDVREATGSNYPYLQSGPWIPDSAFTAVAEDIANVDAELLAGSSFSIEVTSGDDTLWTNYHAAKQRDDERPGVARVDGNSQYRIASITKVFTTLGVLYQHAAGNLSLDGTIDKYISELTQPDSGKLPWKDITLRSLASQL